MILDGLCRFKKSGHPTAVSVHAAPDFLADSIMNILDNDHLWGVTWTDRSLTGPGSAVFQTWLERAMNETRPALVRRSVAAEPASLKARGIEHIVAPPAGGASIGAYAYSGATSPGPKT